MNEEISKIYVLLKGDHTVGIGDSSAVIQADGDFLIPMDCIAEEDQAAQLEEMRDKAADLFECMWGERPTVLFDFEYENDGGMDAVSCPGYQSALAGK